MRHASKYPELDVFCLVESARQPYLNLHSNVADIECRYNPQLSMHEGGPIRQLQAFMQKMNSLPGRKILTIRQMSSATGYKPDLKFT
jgi:hypothetical protein